MDEANLFLVVCRNRTRSHGLKLEHTLYKHVEELLYGNGDGGLEEIAQRSYGVSFYGDIQGPSGHYLCDLPEKVGNFL